jgi:hypothetical protein
MGDDGGCFAAALAAVRRFGGVIEHPADSHAWAAHGIPAPTRGSGWLDCGDGGWTCYVEQGNYGHFSRKPTWLFYVGERPAELDWTIGAQRLDPRALERYGYKKARRIGSMSWIGGRNKTRIRNGTPPAFRDVLIRLAQSSRPNVEADRAGQSQPDQSKSNPIAGSASSDLLGDRPC